MSTDKKTVSKNAKAGKKGKKRDFLSIFKRIGRYFKEVWAELKKVTWPTRKDFLTYTLAVFVFVVIMTAIVFAMDTGLTTLLNLMLGA